MGALSSLSAREWAKARLDCKGGNTTLTHTCTHTHLCTCQFLFIHTEGMEQESVFQSFATSQFAEHKPATHTRTHHMSKSLTSLDTNGWKDFMSHDFQSTVNVDCFFFNRHYIVGAQNMCIPFLSLMLNNA